MLKNVIDYIRKNDIFFSSFTSLQALAEITRRHWRNFVAVGEIFTEKVLWFRFFGVPLHPFPDGNAPVNVGKLAKKVDLAVSRNEKRWLLFSLWRFLATLTDFLYVYG